MAAVPERQGDAPGVDFISHVELCEGAGDEPEGIDGVPVRVVEGFIIGLAFIILSPTTLGEPLDKKKLTRAYCASCALLPSCGESRKTADMDTTQFKYGAMLEMSQVE